MTRLCDDGFLETDSAIVAACFLGMNAHFVSWDRKEPSQGLYRVNAVMPNGWNNHEWPIRIPAATVAEVWHSGEVPFRTLLASICHEPSLTLNCWLRKHTEIQKR